MATIRKRNGKWQVQIRRKTGFSKSSTFTSRKDAERWAAQTEIEAERQEAGIATETKETPPLKELIERYRQTILPLKRSAYQEGYILNALARERFATLPIERITASEIASFRDRRLTLVSASTLNRTLGVLSHVFETARTEWGFTDLINPVRLIRKPKANPPRERRLLAEEEACLLQAACASKNTDLRDVILFAIETAMRMSEILGIGWQDVDFERRLVFLRLTKNGRSRHVPLSTRAIGILSDRKALGLSGPFPSSQRAIQQAWLRAVRRSGIEDLHFHDLRHEAISRLFEKGFSLPEVGLISGHRDPRQLLRYTHLGADGLVNKFNCDPK